MSGILGSLVSITAICGVVRPGESILIGFIGAAVATVGWQVLERFEVDDPVGAVSIHAGGSIWGMIAVGMFVEPDKLKQNFSNAYGAFKGGNVKILGIQVLACVVISIWTVVTVGIQFFLIDKVLGLRLSMEDELLGADDREHGISHDNIDLIEERPNCRSRMSRRNMVSPQNTEHSTHDARPKPKRNNENGAVRRNTEVLLHTNANQRRVSQPKEKTNKNINETLPKNHKVEVHKSRVDYEDEGETEIEHKILFSTSNRKAEGSSSRSRSQSLVHSARIRKPHVTITITPAD
jgi:hypothetical protein